MKLFIDGNILLDVLQKREPHYRDSSMIWKLCETEKDIGYVSSLSLNNLVYVMRRELNPAEIRDVLKKLSLIFHFIEVKPSDLEKAAEKKGSDYEDAVQCVSAERVDADYIITRNVRDYRESPVPALTPSEYLMRL